MNVPIAQVVGVGHLGRIHARLVAAMPDVELVGVADPVAAARITPWPPDAHRTGAGGRLSRTAGARRRRRDCRADSIAPRRGCPGFSPSRSSSAHRKAAGQRNALDEAKDELLACGPQERGAYWCKSATSNGFNPGSLTAAQPYLAGPRPYRIGAVPAASRFARRTWEWCWT